MDLTIEFTEMILEISLILHTHYTVQYSLVIRCCKSKNKELDLKVEHIESETIISHHCMLSLSLSIAHFIENIAILLQLKNLLNFGTDIVH